MRFIGTRFAPSSATIVDGYCWLPQACKIAMDRQRCAPQFKRCEISNHRGCTKCAGNRALARGEPAPADPTAPTANHKEDTLNHFVELTTANSTVNLDSHNHHRSSTLKSAFVIGAAATMLLASVTGFAENKNRTLSGWVGGDITAQNGKVEWQQAGAFNGNPLCSQTANGDSGNFVVGAGAQSSANNGLCTQTQSSAWDVKASYDKPNNRTTWGNKAGGGAAKLVADATVPNKPGTSSAKTSFSTTGAVNFGTNVGITGAGAKDDAALVSVMGSLVQASDSESFMLNGSMVLGVDSLLLAQNGASASVNSSGLTLLASSDQFAQFSAEELNNYDPSQNQGWWVSFDGSTLAGSGIDLGLFQDVSGGVFLPYDEMPGNDLVATVGSGDLEYDATAFASEQDTPEPGTLVLFGSGLLGLTRFLRKRGLDQT